MATFDPNYAGSDSAQDDAIRARNAAKAKAAADRATAKAAAEAYAKAASERQAGYTAERVAGQAKAATERIAAEQASAKAAPAATQGAAESAGGFARKVKNMFSFGAKAAPTAEPIAAKVGMTGAQQAAASAAPSGFRTVAGNVLGTVARGAGRVLGATNPYLLAGQGLVAGMQANTEAYNADPLVQKIEGTPKGQQYAPLKPAQIAVVESGTNIPLSDKPNVRTTASDAVNTNVPTEYTAPEIVTPESQIARANALPTTAVTPVPNAPGVYGFRDAGGVQNYTDGRQAGIVPTTSDADREAAETARLSNVYAQQKINDRAALSWQLRGAQSDINLAGNPGSLRAAKERYANLVAQQDANTKQDVVDATKAEYADKSATAYAKAAATAAEGKYQRGRDTASDTRAENAATDTAIKVHQDRLANFVGEQQVIIDKEGQQRATNVPNPSLAAEISAAYSNSPTDVGNKRQFHELSDAEVGKFAGAYQLSKLIQTNKGKTGAELKGTIPTAWQLYAHPESINVDANGAITYNDSIINPNANSIWNKPSWFGPGEISESIGNEMAKYINQLKGQF